MTWAELFERAPAVPVERVRETLAERRNRD
jgi:hypothetical protein